MKGFAASAIMMLLAGTCFAGEIGQSACSSKKAIVDEPSAYPALHEFLNTLAIIRDNYVDADKVTWQKLFHNALTGVVRELDPFSEYEDPETFQSRQQAINGSKIGIGVVISRRARGIEIISVIPDSPAQQAGVKSGDVIIDIDNESAENMLLSDASAKLRGDEESVLLMNVYRPSNDQMIPFQIERKKFHVDTITGARILPDTDGIGYMHLTQFGRTSVSDFDKAAAKLMRQNMTCLILDLRDNPGGLVESVAPLCSRFLKAKQPIVSIEGRNEEKRVLTSEEKDGTFAELPLIVLVNGYSASAAEIFAACMRDYHRAILIGERTYGKGSVQTLFTMENGSALRLTTALYYTPGRHRIHGKGIRPDVAVNVSSEARTRLSSQLTTHPGQILPPVPYPVRDTALERSIEIFNGMKIFKHKKNDLKISSESTK